VIGLSLRRDIANSIKKLVQNDLDTFMINISISTSLTLSDWMGVAEPGDYANRYLIDIELYLDDNYETKKVIGRSVCIYFGGFDWANDKFKDLAEIADSLSGSALSAIFAVTDNNGQVIDDYMGCNVLYIEEFFLQPEYRDMGIGTMVFPLIIDILGRDAGVITIIPTPNEDDGSRRSEIKDPDYQFHYNQICKFIMNYGFFCLDRGNRVWAKDTSKAD
jgi:hypothetical protein